MDTTVMEYTAEDLISHKLQRAEILVAKPKFDQEGADLLAFRCVSDGAKFCRIQCKGRSLILRSSTQIAIPKHYVSNGLVVFLFVDTRYFDVTHLYCFFERDICAWSEKTIKKEKNYCLTVTSNKLENGTFKSFAFEERKVEEIKQVIREVDVKRELKLIRGFLDVTLDDATLDATGTLS
jgi:hypothetical protein